MRNLLFLVPALLLPAFGQQNVEVAVPYGTPVSMALQSGLSSQSVEKGATVPVVVTEPVVVQGRTVISRGTVTVGRVIEVHRAGHFYASGLITLEVSEVAAVDGTTVPLLYRTTRGSKRKEAPWIEGTLKSPLLYAFIFTIPVVVAVAGSQKGDVLEMPASTSFIARVGLPARDLDAARRSVTRAARGVKEARFPLWLDRPAFLSGALLQKGRYTATVVNRDARLGDLYLFSGNSISRKSLAASVAVDLESVPPDSPSGVSYVSGADGGIRVAEIRLAGRRWVVREPAIIVRVEGGTS